MCISLIKVIDGLKLTTVERQITHRTYTSFPQNHTIDHEGNAPPSPWYRRAKKRRHNYTEHNPQVIIQASDICIENKIEEDKIEATSMSID
jgi:hypothetical protein